MVKSLTMAVGSLFVGSCAVALVLAAPAFADGAVPANSVGATQLKLSAVVSSKIKNGTVSSSDLAASAVTSSRIKDSTIASADILNGGVTSADILDGTITALDIDQSVWSEGVHDSGLLMDRPLALPTNAGFFYFATDVDGGTLYRSDGSSWSQIAGSVSGNIVDDSVNSASIEDGSIDSVDIEDGTISVGDINQSTWSSSVIGTGTAAPAAGAGNNGYLFLDTDDVGGPTLYRSDGSSWIKTGRGATESTAVGGAAGGDLAGTYPSPTIAAGAVTTSKISADAVSSTHIGDDAVRADEIQAQAVGTSEIENASITASDLSAQAVGSAAIADDAVTSQKIAPSTIDTTDVQNASLTISDFDQTVWSNNVINSGLFGSAPSANVNNVGFLYFATDINGGTMYRSNGSSWVKIARGASESDGGGAAGGDLTGTYPNPSIANGVITSSKLGTGAVDSTALGTGAVTNAKLGATAVDTANIANGAVTTAKLGVDAVTVDELDDDSVNSASIIDGNVVEADIAQAVWTSVHGAGLDAAKPIATANNAGELYLSTDVNGGTMYRSNGSTWDQVAKGVSEGSDASGTAGGDLSGTYPNPEISSNAVTTSEILNGTITTDDIENATVTAADLAEVPAVRTFNSANISVTGGAWKLLTFNSEGSGGGDGFDTDAMHDTSTNTSRITFNTPGIYNVTGMIKWAASTAGPQRQISIRLNAGGSCAAGTTVALNEADKSTASSSTLSQTATAIYRFSQGDYIEMCAKLPTTTNVLYVAGESPVFMAHYVSR